MTSKLFWLHWQVTAVLNVFCVVHLCGQSPPGEARAILALLESSYTGISQGVAVQRSPVFVRECKMSVKNIIFAKVRCRLLSTPCFACLLQHSEWLSCCTKSSLCSDLLPFVVKVVKAEGLSSLPLRSLQALLVWRGQSSTSSLSLILTVQAAVSIYANLSLCGWLRSLWKLTQCVPHRF